MQENSYLVLSEGGLRVRSQPSLASTATGLLPKGNIVNAQETREEWIKHETGWSLLKNESKVFLKAFSARWQVLSAGGLRIRKEPDGEPVGVLPQGTVITALEVKDVGTTTWVKHGTGWSMLGTPGKQFLTDHVIPPFGGQQQVPSVWRVLSEGGLRVRAAPSLSATAFGVLPKGTIITSLERKDDWMRHDKGWSLIQAKGKSFLEEVLVGAPASTTVSGNSPSVSVASIKHDVKTALGASPLSAGRAHVENADTESKHESAKTNGSSVTTIQDELRKGPTDKANDSSSNSNGTPAKTASP
jgi:hypothetical protein